jgi:hypothetical protein
VSFKLAESHVFTALSMVAVLALLIVGAFKLWNFVAMRFRARATEPVGPPTYMLIRRIEGADATRVLEILGGEHGLFRFDEMKWIAPYVDDEYDYEEEGYWSPVTCSGLYDSAEAAERDARAQIPWLRDMTSA